MDIKTQDAYNKNAKELAIFFDSIKPNRLYQLAESFFKKNESTLDLGCGNGRDTEWLNVNHFPAMGLDNSIGLLKIARENYSQLSFMEDELPALAKIADASYTNIFSSAVLQHIPRSELIEAIRNILRITKPEGKIILSFRGTKNIDLREDEKLYESYQIGQIASILESFGGRVTFEEEIPDTKRNLNWKIIFVEKKSQDKKSGLERIQDIIQRDSKTATYKFALIRAMCEISRYEPHVIYWPRENDRVLIPIKRLAIRWLNYYFPLIKNDVKQTSNKNLAFEKQLKELDYKKSDLFLFLQDLETNNKLKSLIKKVSETIIKGHITFSGGKAPLFKYLPNGKNKIDPDILEGEHGMMSVPNAIWRDINLYSHWIEDSLVLQWSYMSQELNNSESIAKYFELHSQNYLKPKRDTYDIRKLYKNKTPICIWSGKKIKDFAVDHMIPWSVWHNNDLWNLLPSDPNLNLTKKALIPSPKLIERSFERVKEHWGLYLENFEQLYTCQIKYSLGISAEESVTKIGLEALIHTVERIHTRMGNEYYSGSI